MATTAAMSAAVREFRFVLSGSPGAEQEDLYARRTQNYNLGWAAYKNTVFDDLVRLKIESAKSGLYRNTKGLYNPVSRLVKFYEYHVYPGGLSDDGQPPQGIRDAMPLPVKTDPRLREAIAQCWQWSHWQQGQRQYVKFGAAMGDVFLEVSDDVERGKVYASVLHPSLVTHTEFDAARSGVLNSYTTERTLWDAERQKQFVYKRQIDKAKIRTFYDNEPHAFGGVPSEIDNPYGFVPCVLAKHDDDLTLPGSPAVRHWSKVLELNALSSRVLQYMVRQSKMPIILAGAGNLGVPKINGRAQTDDDVTILSTDKEFTAHELQGSLNLEAAHKVMEGLLREIEDDHPECVMYRKLRDTNQISGRAVEMLTGDVAMYLHGAQANYDAPNVRLHQMLLAIGGMRARERASGWRDLSDQQRKYLPFDLGSYTRGDLDFSIAPRPLVPLTPKEVAEEKQAQYATYQAGVDAGFPLPYQLEKENLPPEEIRALEEAQNRQFVASQRDVVEAITQ